jgi:hypothetical protein
MGLQTRDMLALLVGYGILGGAVAWSIVSAAEPIYGPTSLLDDGTVTANGEGPADPEGLAAGAGVEVNRYALARALHSEQAGGPRIARVGVAWAIVNEARAVGRSVLSLVTRAGRRPKYVGVDGAVTYGAWTPHPTGNGFFGKQSQGRYCATSRDPNADDFEVADDVLSGRVDDPTGGARQFDSPDAFGVQEGTTAEGADETAARRIAAGNELVLLPGVPESTLRFWRPT